MLQTEQGIALIKDIFPKNLAQRLSLTKISAPLFIKSGTGINDDLNGIEKPVQFYLKNVNYSVEIVQSLAKWKRARLHELSILPGNGILTDMRAIRPDEDISPIHSYYVDQWDWEKCIEAKDRTIAYLKETVKNIYECIKATAAVVQKLINSPELQLPEDIYFIHAEELLSKYPDLMPKERENKVVQEYRAVFIMGIGGKLANNEPHDGRAPDYDDWSTQNDDGHTGLNGDLMVWNPILNRAFELSSMGIRVNSAAIEQQLVLLNCQDRRSLHFHSNVISGTYPQSIGGGIGQSRLCMFLLQKEHIAEVQSSVWPQ